MLCGLLKQGKKNQQKKEKKGDWKKGERRAENEDRRDSQTVDMGQRTVNRRGCKQTTKGAANSQGKGLQTVKKLVKKQREKR